LFSAHRIFWLPKDPGDPESYQDACKVDEQRGVAAIADGVSSSLFSGSWAQILVRGVVEEPPDVADRESLPPWLASRRAVWRAPLNPERLAWHQKPKFEHGAHSTLLWVELYPREATTETQPGSFHLLAYSIGDCCLLHIRQDQVLRAFPIEQSAAFEADPAALCSREGDHDRQLAFDTLEDTCQPDDLLVLTSDAIAQWAIRELEARRPVSWEACWDLKTDQWREQVLELRRQQRIRHDDSTVVMLRVGSAPEPETDNPVVQFVDSVADRVRHSRAFQWFKGKNKSDG